MWVLLNSSTLHRPRPEVANSAFLVSQSDISHSFAFTLHLVFTYFSYFPANDAFSPFSDFNITLDHIVFDCHANVFHTKPQQDIKQSLLDFHLTAWYQFSE